MKKQAIKTLMKKPAREPICSQPDDADTGDNRPFAVEANVNLYGTAIMLVHASNETAATKLAEEELEHAEFTILADNESGVQIYPSLMNENVDAQILEVYEDEWFVPDPCALNNRMEMCLGRRLFAKIKDLVRSETCVQESESRIRYELQKFITTEVFNDSWQIYLQLRKDRR